MEPEINLGRYLSALRKWYRLILVAPLLAGLAALVVSFLTPPTYAAEADFAIVTDSSKVNFDPKFQTVSAADQLQQAIDQTARRKGLTTIAGSPDIAAAVIAKLGSQLDPSLRIPTNLLNSINTVNDGDLIKITAKANSPDKAALIANTWAQEYENRVNAAYGDNPLSPGEVQAQADATKQDYDAKEASLVAYVGNNPIDQLTRQVAEKQQIISSLQAGKNTAVKTIVDKELEARSQIIAAYLSAQAQDRLIAFTKEQEGKTKLVGSYLDAIINSRLAVFNQQASAKIQNLADVYTIENKIDRLLADANSLRSRLTSGSPSSARGDELAGLLLEASAFSTWSSLPVNLQIPIDQLSTGATTADQLRNLDSLIATLQDRRKTVQADIDTQSKDLLNNSGYEFLDANAFGNDSVMNAVKQQYPELFAVGDLTQLTDSLDPNNPLAQAADANSKNLLQLVGLENVIAYSTGDQTMTKAVDQLQQEVNQLQAQLEQENAKKQDLTQARDLAWSTYTTLANKVAEVTVASQAKGSVVRLAVPAVPPDQPSAPKKTLNTLLAAVVGLLLAIGCVFLLEFFNEGVKTEEEMGALLGLPMVGAIPELPKLGSDEKIARNGSGVLAVQDPRSATTEAFRLLRHNLFTNHSGNGAGAEKTSRSLLIASAVPSEGKSTIAANLALLLAHSDRKVVLVDADLRHPSQHRIFGLKNGTGLVNILVESVENWERYAQATDVKDLTVITSGPLPPDPAQLLESLELKRLIEKLKSSYDIVIIDTPAVLGLADALAVARVTDGILMVVESDGVSRGDAARAKEILASTGVPIIGVVMNRTAAAPGAVTYGYYDRLRGRMAATPNGHKRVGAVMAQAQNVWWPEMRDRVLDWVGPRRG